MAVATIAERIPKQPALHEVVTSFAPLIAGQPAGKNLLSSNQLGFDDILDYITDARAAEAIVRNDSCPGINLLPFNVMKAIMQQSSTRTGGTMTTAMNRLGGKGELISGMQASAEAKGESPAHTWVAFDSQLDILGIRSKDNDGPYLAAQAVQESFGYGKLWKTVPVINLGNGTDEHPTQALADVYAIAKWQGFDLDKLDGLTMAVVGDHERYRAFHSLLITASKLGMKILAVETEAAPVPETLVDQLGGSLERTLYLDEAMQEADVLYVGRNPDEYDGYDMSEWHRTKWIKDSYAGWVINRARLQQMKENSIVLHPRPINGELTRDVEADHRMWDVEEMNDLVPIRMAIQARSRGRSIARALCALQTTPGLSLPEIIERTPERVAA